MRERIGQEIRRYLTHAQRVPANVRQIFLSNNADLARQLGGRRVAHQGDKIDFGAFDAEPAARDARDEQQVIDEARELMRSVERNRQQFVATRPIELPIVFVEQRCGAADGRKRAIGA
ncbi:MAG: hypothetical protein NVS2B17_21230 [Candidatus Velthaea sp.]